MQEDVYQTGDDDPNQTHHQEAAHAAEVGFRRVAPNAHGGEGASGNEEHPDDRFRCVGDEDACQAGAHHAAEQPEQGLRRRRRQLVHPQAEHEDESERGEYGDHRQHGRLVMCDLPELTHRIPEE